MKPKTKLFVALAVLLLLALGAGEWWRRSVRPSSGVSGETPAADSPATGAARGWQSPAATAAVAPGTVDGVVVDGEGQPVAGAVVALARRLAPALPSAPLMAGTTTSGADGRFRLGDLAPGTFTATATSPRPGLLPAVERGIAIASGATGSVHLVLVRGGFTIQGRVLEAGGGVLPAARVTVRATPSAAGARNDAGLVFLTASDARGAWSVTLPAGQYAIAGEFDGYAPGSIAVTLTADTRADLVLEPAGGIFGRVIHAVTGEPIAGARVQVIPTFRRGRRAPAVESDVEGKFRLQQLGMGDVYVQARRGRLVGQGGPLPVVPARAVTGLEIRVQEAFAIAGRVLAADARPAAGIPVMAESSVGTGVAWAESTAAGEFGIEGVLPGDYQIQVWLKDGGRARRDVTVVDRDVAGADLNITAGLIVRGHVDDQQGRPAPSVRVMVTTEAGADATRYNRLATSDARGDFQLPPDIPWGTLSARAGRADQGIALWGPRPTEPGTTVQVNLRLEDGARLTGLVRKDDGLPAAGARVLVVNPEGERGERAEAVAGPDGRYRLTALAPGWARAAAGASSAPRFEDGSTRVQLIAGQQTTLDLRVPAAASIRGIVQLPDGRPGSGALVLASATADKPWPEQARRALAASDGTFLLDGLAGGRRYHLWIDLPGHTTAHLSNVAAGAAGQGRVRVSLTR